MTGDSPTSLQSPYTLRRLADGLEPVEGLTLPGRMAPGQGLPPLEALRYALHVATSLVEAHSKRVGHGRLGPEWVVLERIERHCCEAEKFRAKLTYPVPQPPWSGALAGADVVAFGELLGAMLRSPGQVAEAQNVPQLSELRQLAAACLEGRLRSMPRVLRALERHVERHAFGEPRLGWRLAAWALDALGVGAVFWRSPAIALAVWLVYDIGTRFAVERTLGERLCGLPPDRSIHNLLFRWVLFSMVAGILWLAV